MGDDVEGGLDDRSKVARVLERDAVLRPVVASIRLGRPAVCGWAERRELRRSTCPGGLNSRFPRIYVDSRPRVILAALFHEPASASVAGP